MGVLLLYWALPDSIYLKGTIGLGVQDAHVRATSCCSIRSWTGDLHFGSYSSDEMIQRASQQLSAEAPLDSASTKLEQEVVLPFLQKEARGTFWVTTNTLRKYKSHNKPMLTI